MPGIEEVLVVSDIIQNIWSYTVYNVLPAIILLLIGWVIGKILGRITRGVLRKLNADRYFKFGRGFEVSNMFSIIVAWTIYLLFIISAVDVLKIEILTTALWNVLTFLGGVIQGIIIILAGYVLAKYIQGQVVATRAEYSDFVGKIIFFFTMIVAVGLALPFVFGEKAALVNNIILILVGSIGLGMAIALGLGLKDTVAKIAKKYTKRV
jgi:hypothetical protein